MYMKVILFNSSFQQNDINRAITLYIGNQTSIFQLYYLYIQCIASSMANANLALQPYTFCKHYISAIKYLQFNHKSFYFPTQLIQKRQDAKGVTGSHKSQKYRQHNGHKKQNRKTSNDLQNSIQKTNDRVTRTPLKILG